MANNEAMSYLNKLGPIATTLFLINGLTSASVEAAARPVLNQSPQTLQRYFGQPWTRLTETQDNGRTLVTYTYNPTKLRRLFPEARDLRFSVVFVKNQAQQIRVDSGNAAIVNYPQRADQFFAYVFGYFPSTNSTVYKKVLPDDSGLSGSLQYTVYCLGNGIATGHEWHSVPDVTLHAELYFESRCQGQ